MADNKLANHPVTECRNPTELTSGDLIGLTVRVTSNIQSCGVTHTDSSGLASSQLTAETGLLSAAAIIVVILLLVVRLHFYSRQHHMFSSRATASIRPKPQGLSTLQAHHQNSSGHLHGAF